MIVDAEIYNLGSLKDKVSCPYCNANAYVAFKHGPLTPGQNIGFAMGCVKCPAMFHLDEKGKIFKTKDL